MTAAELRLRPSAFWMKIDQSINKFKTKKSKRIVSGKLKLKKKRKTPCGVRMSALDPLLAPYADRQQQQQQLMDSIMETEAFYIHSFLTFILNFFCG